MRHIPSILLAVLWVTLAVASSAHKGFEVIARHARLARQSPAELLIPRNKKVKRNSCSAKSTSSSKASAATQEAKVQITSSSSSSGSVAGLIEIASQCGPTGATKTVTKLSGPNGNINWLNCGINSGGWRPPDITMDNVIIQDIDTNGAFAPCKPYISLFEKYANQVGIHPIMAASIAMQESGCNPETVGGAGEQGLMQITADKCGGAPGGNCKDPDFNIRVGVEFFSELLKESGGNIPVACGRYNGWFVGITFADATAAAKTSCCRCQNNLDYVHQTLNGWYQNINPYNAELGEYFNLNICFESS